MGPGGDLGVQVARDRAGQPLQQFAPGAAVAVHQRLGVQVIAAGTAFDHVAGQRERRAGKADQRKMGRQVAARLPDRFHDEIQRVDAFQLQHAVHVRRFADRVVDHRAFALGELQVHAHRLQDRQQVGEDDRGVHAQARHGGTHHLAAQRRVLAQFQEGGLGPHLAVLRHVPARLPHQPDGRELDTARGGRLS